MTSITNLSSVCREREQVGLVTSKHCAVRFSHGNDDGIDS